jgi:hypothetical protein
MLKTICATLLLVLLATAILAGGEPWKTKPYTQWDEKDVAAVLQTSPWAKVNLPSPDALKTSNPVADNSASTGAQGSMPGHSNPATATVPTQLGGAESGSPGPDAGAKTYSIFWWSSRTIREAFARRAVLKGGMTQQNADKIVAASPESYQILVNSPGVSVFEDRGEDALKDAAFIELKKEKKKISPTSVVFQRSSGKVVGVLFNFPKKDAGGEASIPADEKQIDFNLRINDAWLRTGFNLKQMTDMQGQDL